MLNSLKVLNGSLSPNFNSNIYEYEVEVDDAISLILEYDTSDNATVTIYGNDNLTEGENHVLIEVFDEKVITYTLLVNKKTTETVAGYDNIYEKVEVSIKDEFLHDLITPGITVICFITIVILYSIIFHKRK